MVIFCQLPAVVTFIITTARLLEIEVITLASFQIMEQRDTIIDTFNESLNRPMILIMTYAVGSTGLNLQKDCKRVHCLKGANNLGILSQSLGRVRRLGNPNDIVYIYEYFVKGTFDDRNVWRNIEKVVPQAIAELNRQIFYGEDEDEVGDVDLGNWVMIDGKLTRHDTIDPIDGVTLDILTPHELLKYLLLQAKGE